MTTTEQDPFTEPPGEEGDDQEAGGGKTANPVKEEELEDADDLDDDDEDDTEVEVETPTTKTTVRKGGKGSKDESDG